MDSTENAETVERSIRRGLRLVAIATMTLFMSLVGIGSWVYYEGKQRDHRLSAVAISTNTALCALRSDLVRRIQDSQTFLAQNPKGAPGLATAEQIKLSIQNQQLTVAALAVLSCKGG